VPAAKSFRWPFSATLNPSEKQEKGAVTPSKAKRRGKGHDISTRLLTVASRSYKDHCVSSPSSRTVSLAHSSSLAAQASI
jgi:hypothetical protein